jgi:1-acyl-sn-glycerol-3-phosphate acyltransferase
VAVGFGRTQPRHQPRKVVRGTLISGFRQLLRIYFRKVTVTGELPSPETTGRVFLPNHVNGLVDPLLVLTTAPCAISPIGKAPLWRIPVLGFLLDAIGAVPVVRRRDDPAKAKGANDALFQKVGTHLAGGGNILVFPEGTSHNKPHLEKMRTGPARMMLRARGRDVSFQAVGLEFEARHVFRSRALVLYGPVRRVADMVNPGTSDDDAAKEITHAVELDLASLIVTGDNWEDRRLIARVAELLAHESGDNSFLHFSETARAVRDTGRELAERSPESIDPVRYHVGAYYDVLEREGFDDLAIKQHDPIDGVPMRLRHGRIGPAAMIAMLPLAAFGFVLYAVPYHVPRFVTSRAADRDLDLASTLKLATGLLVFPLWAALVIAFGFVLFPAQVALWIVGLVFLSALPALFWLDAVEDGLLRRRSPPEVLRELRAAAVAAIDSAQKVGK